MLVISLALSYYHGMNFRDYARVLGRRGGKARAKNLSPEQRTSIATLGGKTRALSRHAVRRIEENFKYVEAIEALKKATIVRG